MNYISNEFNGVSCIRECEIPEFYEALKTVFDSLTLRALSSQFRLRTKTELADHLNAGMPLLAIRRGGFIVGTAMLCYPDQYKTRQKRVKALGGYPLKDFDPKNVTVMQAVSVRPFMRGRGVAREIFENTAALSIAGGRADILAKVHAFNKESLAMFKHYGFVVHSTSKDSKTGRPVCYMHADSLKLWGRLNHDLAGWESTPLANRGHRPTI